MASCSIDAPDEHDRGRKTASTLPGVLTEHSLLKMIYRCDICYFGLNPMNPEKPLPLSQGKETSPAVSTSFSRLMLGTVQFGLNYGIANRTGQPSYNDVVRILEAAWEGGICCLDTAAAYGDSEQRIGAALWELRLQNKMTVVTKIHPLTPDAHQSVDAARRAIGNSIEQSRQRLQLDCLPIVLFHNEHDARWIPLLSEQKDLGRIGGFGVSCDNIPGPGPDYLHAGATALQIPGSLVDRRHERSGLFETAAESATVSLFLRSVFLQGLLTMDAQEIPEELCDIIPVRNRLCEIGRGFGIRLTELALRYALSLPGVTSIIVGVESVAQVQENVAMSQRGPLDPELLLQIRQAVPELRPEVITPRVWKPNKGPSAP